MVYAGEQVHEQVPGDARSVILIVAPAEEADRIKRMIRRRPDKRLPVDVLRGHVRWDGVLPRADGIPPVIARLHHVDLADRTGAHQIARLVIDDVALELTSDLHDAARAALSVDRSEERRVGDAWS